MTSRERIQAVLNHKQPDQVCIDFCGTDFGTQTSSFCSVDTDNDLFGPYSKKMNNWIPENTQWKTFIHSCGVIKSIILSLIGSGFDILNPVQCSATGMEPVELKKNLGMILYSGVGPLILR